MGVSTQSTWEAVQNEWIRKRQERADQTCEKEHPSHPSDFFSNLQEFSSLNCFSKVAKHLVAHRVSQKEVNSLKAAFEKMDTNEDGVLSLPEMLAGCASAGIHDRDAMAAVFKQID